MPKKIESQNLVVKSNELIEARYRLTAGEQKIIYKLTTIINKNDEDFKLYSFAIKDLAELLNTNNKNLYTEVKETTKDLMKKVFSIKDKIKKSELQVSWFSSVEYKDGEGIVELEFSPKLKPFLLQLKEAFTKFDIHNVMQLRSGYSCRFYELLKQYEILKERVITIEEIRNILGIQENEYKNFNDFKRKVILQAQKEINTKTDICFDFEEIKGVRKKVSAIKFIIKENTTTSDINIDPHEEVTTEQDIVQAIKTEFKKLYKGELKANLIQNMIDTKGIEHVKNVLNNLKDYIGQSQIKHIERFFYRCVMDNYTKSISYTTKPAYANFEQREYTDESWEEIIRINQEKYTSKTNARGKEISENSEIDSLTPEELREKLKKLIRKK